jgi:hypothetical protein
MKRVENDAKDPATGKATASSPNAWHVQYSMTPIHEKAMSKDAGPPLLSACPEATNSPVPNQINVSRRLAARQKLKKPSRP